MENWKEHSLQEVTTRIGDGLHGTPVYDDNGSYYFINGSNLLNGKVVINENTKRVSSEQYEKHKKELSDRTVLLGINGTIGNVALYQNEKCILGKSAAYLNVKEDFDKLFLKYVLLNPHFQNFIQVNATGTTIKNVGLGLLRSYKFLAPESKTEQQKIASILSSLDDKIELNNQMNQTLEQIAQAIFKEWFVDFNFPGFDGNLVDGLPKGWRKGKIVEEFNLTMGQSPKGESLNIDKEGIIFYQGRTDYGFRFPQPRVYTTSPTRFANQLDTLVCVRAPVGDINMAIDKCCVGRGLAAIMHKKKAFSYTLYLMKYLEPVFKTFEKEGTVFGAINKAGFENIEHTIPSFEIISLFEKTVNVFDEKIIKNSLENEQLIEIRNSLIPRLLSGNFNLN